MFYNLKGKFLSVQDGISAGLRNLKTTEDKQKLESSVNYNAGTEILIKKETQWEELQTLSKQNFQKAQDVDEQITKLRRNVATQWGQIKEINQFISSVPEFINTMRNVNESLASLQNLAMEIEESLDAIEDLVGKREMKQKQIEENVTFANYLEQKMMDTDLLKAKLDQKYKLRVLEHEKNVEETLKERQQLCNIAFQEDMKLYKESGILPTTKKTDNSPTVTLEDIQIDDSLEDLNELLNN